MIFRYLQTRSRVDIWLFENVNMRMEGHIVGFDEYMNIVLDDAEEVYLKTKTRKQIGMPSLNPHSNQLNALTFSFSTIAGRVLLKGDNITLIQNAATEDD